MARQGLSGDDPARDLAPETLLRAAEDRGLMLQPDGAGFAAYLEGEPVDDELRSADGHLPRVGHLGDPGGAGMDQQPTAGDGAGGPERGG